MLVQEKLGKALRDAELGEIDYIIPSFPSIDGEAPSLNLIEFEGLHASRWRSVAPQCRFTTKPDPNETALAKAYFFSLIPKCI